MSAEGYEVNFLFVGITWDSAMQGNPFPKHCTMVLAIEIKERKICKSKWLDFTHFSTNYYFFGLYCCETANI